MKGLKGYPPPLMPYPTVLSEEATIDAALAGRSIARFGDGELRLCCGGKHIAQEWSKDLQDELRSLLVHDTLSLVCIPNVMVETRKPKFWTKYSTDEYRVLYDMKREYGSSLICRPDSAPWIDTDEYWRKCRRIWKDRNVVLVIGDRGGSFVHLKHARNVAMVYGAERDAYRDIEKICADAQMAAVEVGENPIVMICLGAAATCMAERLARHGLQALDLGHMGRFMPQRFLQ